MKKTLKIAMMFAALTAFVLLMSIWTCAESCGDFIYTLNDGDATVTGYTGTATDVVIPETVDGHTVTAIGESAFSKMGLTSAFIPKTVSRIEAYAFFSNAELKKVVFNEGLTYIGKYAFQICTALSDYELPQGLVTIGALAFNNTAVASITIPKSLVTLENGAFRGVSTLKYVNFDMNSSLASIGYGCFQDCTSLRSIEIPKSVTYVDANAFNGCTSLQSVIYESGDASVTIAGGFVENCTSVIRVDLPNGLKRIGMEFFNECANLERVIIPDSVTDIGEHAFLNCNKLKTITLGRNIKKITDSITPVDDTTGIFNGCYRLEAIYLWRNSYADTYCKNHSDIAPLIVYLDDMSTTELDFTLSNDGKYYIVTGIGNCEDSYIEIPEEYNGLPVKAIGEEAFSGKVQIKKVIIPKTVERIEKKAFFGCTALITVLFDKESNLSYIGESAFERCISLVSFEAPYRLMYIGRRAFAGCVSLARVILRELLEWLGDEIFAGCSGVSGNIYTLEGSYADEYCKNNSHSRKHYKKLKSGAVSVSGDSDTEIPSDFEIYVEEIDEEYIDEQFGESLGNKGKKKGHDINLHVDGHKIQPNDSVDIEIDVPENFNGDNCKVYRQEKNGELTEMSVEHHDGKLNFESDHFSIYIIVDETVECDFMTFEGYQVREDGYNGLRSRFIVDFAAMPTLENGGFEVIEVGAIFVSTDKLAANGDEFVVSKSADGTYKTVAYGVTVPVIKNDSIVGKYVSKTENELVFACTITNFDESNYSKNVSSRGYAVLADAEGNEYVVYCDYPVEEYRSVSLEMICDALFEAGQITEDNISYQNVVAFRKED